MGVRPSPLPRHVDRYPGWEMIETACEVIIRPSRNLFQRYIGIVFSALLLAVFVAALITSLYGRSGVIAFAVFSFSGVVVFGVMLLLKIRSLHAPIRPWVELDKKRGSLRFPRLGMKLPAGTIRAVCLGSRGSGFASSESLAMRFDDGSGAAEFDFYQEGPDALVVGGFGEHVQSETHRLAQVLASRLGVTVEHGTGRDPSGLCEGCGYDLRGTLVAGRTSCPECGRVIPEDVIRWFERTRKWRDATT
jgi:hypothetical protein